MSARLVVVLCVAFLSLAIPMSGVAGEKKQNPREESSWLDDWKSRQHQLDRWRKAKPEDITDEIKVTAIDWLEKDVRYSDSHFRRTQEGLGEAYGDYYIELVLFVARLKDRRSIKALSGAIGVAGIVETTLAEFGDEAVPYVIDRLADPYRSSSAAGTLGTFIRGKALGKSPITDNSVHRIRDVLIGALQNESFVTRQTAVESLEHFGPDPNVMGALKAVAKNDPYKRRKKLPGTEAVDDYPVRTTAAAVLGRLSAKQRGASNVH